MKTIKFAIAAALFGSAFSVAPAMADPDKYADPGKATVDFCKAFNEANPDISVGDCMGILRSGGIPGACKDAERFGYLEAAGFKNVGECVKTLRQA